MRAVPVVVVAVFPLFQGEERLVGIEGLDLQVPVVLFAVRRQEFEAGREGPRLRGEVLLLHVLSVYPVLADDPSQVFGNLRIGDFALPGIAFLTAHVFPA